MRDIIQLTMGYLDDYINNAMKPHKRKYLKCIPKIIALIRSNQYNSSNPNHVKWKNVAIKYGYIDSNMNILKGE